MRDGLGPILFRVELEGVIDGPINLFEESHVNFPAGPNELGNLGFQLKLPL